MHVAGGVLLGRLDDLAQRAVYNLREEDQDDEREEQDHNEHQIGDVQHAVGFLVDLRGGSVDDHITSGLVIIDDRSDHAHFLFLERAEKGTSCVVVLLRDGGIKAFYHNLLFRIRRAGGVHDHTSGRIDDPDLGVHEIGEGFHLILHGFQGDLGVIQIHSVSIRDPGRLPVHVPGGPPEAVLVGEPGDKSRHCDKAEEREQNIGQYEFKIECFSHIPPARARCAAVRIAGTE